MNATVIGLILLMFADGSSQEFYKEFEGTPDNMAACKAEAAMVLPVVAKAAGATDARAYCAYAGEPA